MPLRKLVVNLIYPSLKNASRHFAVRASTSSLLAWNKTGKVQKTLAREIVMRGKGLHSGVDVVARLAPAKAGEGRYFVVADHCSNIPANINYGLESALCTTLSKDGCRVRTVEHLLSAMEAMGVDNCRVEIVGGDEVWESCLSILYL